MLGKLVNKLLNRIGLEIHTVPKPPTDAVVTIRVGNYELKANANHAFQEISQRHPGYSRNLPRLVSAVKKKYPNLLMFDVGANIGDTVALVRSECECAIVCIEGDSKYFELLKANAAQFRDVAIFNCFLGEERKTVVGATEKSAGTLKIIDSGSGEIALQSLDAFVQENGPFDSAKLLKIDTDGYDMKILRGAVNYIRQTKPVLFFEYDKLFLSQQREDGISTLDQLRTLGYGEIIFYDNYGRFILSDNLNNSKIVRQMDNYIEDRKGAFEYYDLCIFHEEDHDVARQFIESEMELQRSTDRAA